jgi:hypothetical protein
MRTSVPAWHGGPGAACSYSWRREAGNRTLGGPAGPFCESGPLGLSAGQSAPGRAAAARGASPAGGRRSGTAVAAGGSTTARAAVSSHRCAMRQAELRRPGRWGRAPPYLAWRARLRRALLTALESGNRSATSRSRRTRFVPEAKRAPLLQRSSVRGFTPRATEGGERVHHQTS